MYNFRNQITTLQLGKKMSFSPGMLLVQHQRQICEIFLPWQNIVQ